MNYKQLKKYIVFACDKYEVPLTGYAIMNNVYYKFRVIDIPEQRPDYWYSGEYDIKKMTKFEITKFKLYKYLFEHAFGRHASYENGEPVEQDERRTMLRFWINWNMFRFKW